MIRFNQIDHVAITVADLERSVRWYQEILGLEVDRDVAWKGPPMMMKVGGGSAIALFPASSKNLKLPPSSEQALGMKHFALNVDLDQFEATRSLLESRGIDCTYQDHGSSISIYLLDPDGYEVEITAWTPIKGKGGSISG
ncbi:MAG: VOC family protein [Deltaproteobacteria bacterium]|nr:VOC family protein [Deltaproteobacteria bacterium]